MLVNVFPISSQRCVAPSRTLRTWPRNLPAPDKSMQVVWRQYARFFPRAFPRAGGCQSNSLLYTVVNHCCIRRSQRHAHYPTRHPQPQHFLFVSVVKELPEYCVAQVHKIGEGRPKPTVLRVCNRHNAGLGERCDMLCRRLSSPKSRPKTSLKSTASERYA